MTQQIAITVEKQATLHSIETCGAVDGPGLRYIAFFQGCMMRCLYCHNRDTWPMRTKNSRIVTVADLMKDVRSYQFYLKACHGGVTASGGEPLLQHAFIADWFEACQQININTCLDTNGFVRRYDDDLTRLIEHTDLVMLDLKQLDAEKHKALVGIPNDKTLNFARYLAECNQPTRIRYVVVPGYSDDDASVNLLGEFIAKMDNVLEVEILPYHELGAHKWEIMGDTYKLKDVHAPPQETLDNIKRILSKYGKKSFY